MKRLRCLFTPHKDMLRSDGKRMYVSCLRCGRESRGIVTGGFNYSSVQRQVSGRIADVVRSFKPRRLKRG